jgi:hypothetical protein
MAWVRCVRCEARRDEYHPIIALTCERRNADEEDVELRGIVTCLKDGHEWPVTLRNNVIIATADALPVSESKNLIGDVPRGLVQDVEEAERAHYAHCFKAAVVMGRRAAQLALVEKGITDGPFQRMIDDAVTATPPILSVRAMTLADGIKDYGDGGAHRVEEITASDARHVIYSTVKILNELFPNGR